MDNKQPNRLMKIEAFILISTLEETTSILVEEQENEQPNNVCSLKYESFYSSFK